MANITDYSSLKQAIADWVNSPEIEQTSDQLIQFVEAEMNSKLRCKEQIIRSVATSDNEYVQLPSDWLEAINLHVDGGQQPLRYVTIDRADIINDAQVYTSVRHYSIMDNAIQLIPAPANNVDVQMIYYAKIPALSDVNTSNWLLQKAPDLYLYGSLSHAAPFLLNDQRIPIFSQAYATRVQSLMDESDKAVHSGSPLIAKPKGTYYGRI